MSGPKISVYQLNRASRKIIFEQARCEQQSVLCAQQIQELVQQVLSFSGELQSQISMLDSLGHRVESAAEKREELQKLLKRMKSETDHISSSLKAEKPKISAKYQLSEEALREKKKKLEKINTLKKQAQELLKEVNEYVVDKSKIGNSVSGMISRSIVADLGGNIYSDNGTENKTSDTKLEDSKRIFHSIAADLGGYISFDIAPENDIPDTSFEDRKRELQSELTALFKDPELPKMPPEIGEEIKKAIITLDKIQQIEYLHSFDSVTVKNIVRKINACKLELEEKQAEFNEAYERYKLLCSTVMEPAKTYSYSEESFADMEKEIERLELAVVKIHEQSYVSECVDQVMREMGYDLIGSRDVVKKKSGKKFRNELYTFNEGTAVNVTYASDGQISMELGGIAREDRIPNQEETEMLTKNMQTFCGEFEEFERRLQAKGVVIDHRIALYPPSAEYAAIINVSDYDVAEGTQITEMQSADRRKTAAETNVMRRTE